MGAVDDKHSSSGEKSLNPQDCLPVTVPLTRQTRLLRWWVESRVSNSTKSLISFVVFAILLAIFLFFWGLRGITSIEPSTLNVTVKGTPGVSIAGTEISAQEAQNLREIDVTRQADERLLQMLYFTIGTVLTVAAIIGTFGWFSSAKLSQIESTFLGGRVDALESATKSSLAQVERQMDEKIAYSRVEATILRVRTMSTSNPIRAIEHACVAADSFGQLNARDAFEIREEFNEVIEDLLGELKTEELDAPEAIVVFIEPLTTLASKLFDSAKLSGDHLLQTLGSIVDEDVERRTRMQADLEAAEY